MFYQQEETFAKHLFLPDEFRFWATKSPWDSHGFQHILSVTSCRVDGGGLACENGKWTVQFAKIPIFRDSDLTATVKMR